MLALIRLAASNALHRAGLLHAMAWFRRRVRRERVLILSFHCVSDPAGRYFRDGMNIDRDDFAALLDGLGRHYRFAGLQEAMCGGAESKSGRATVVVTFDDAYRSVYDHAYPVLRERGIPATLFVPTDYIDGGRLLWWDQVQQRWPEDANARVDRLKYSPQDVRDDELADLPNAGGDLMMSWDEIRELAENGFEIGSHSASHPYLDGLTGDALKAELERAHEAIDREVGVAPRSFAYPDGRFNDTVVAELKRLGYTCAVSTVTGSNRADADPFKLKRHDCSQSFGRRFSFAIAWAELLGLWDTMFLRRRRNPERYTTYRPSVS